MDSTSFFTDAQAQVSEAQRKFAELWNESQKQMMDSQQKFADAWMASLPIKMDQGDVSEAIQNTLNFQKELIDSTLKTQEVAVRLTMEVQRQAWDNYFKSVQSMMKLSTSA